jgi:hypothetical protein
MRAVQMFGFLLAALAVPWVASAQGEPPAPPPEPAPAPPPPPEPPPEAAPAPEAAPPPEPAPEAPAPVAAPSAPNTAPLDGRRPGSGLVVGANVSPEQPITLSEYQPDYDALRLTLEARFGFNARLGSSFAASAHEELVDTDFALGGYLAWKREFALGLELEQSGLGRARALSDQNSIDAEYSATGAWLAARVFPLRRERLDLFVNLRIGLVFQHVSALGTRQEAVPFTQPAVSFSCTEWDGPGVGLGGALGLAYRLSRHVSVLSRVDATGARLSGEALGSCADGIGSVSSVSGTIGLAYEFGPAPK